MRASVLFWSIDVADEVLGRILNGVVHQSTAIVVIEVRQAHREAYDMLREQRPPTSDRKPGAQSNSPAPCHTFQLLPFGVIRVCGGGLTTS